jgi:hypothetical protein
MISARPRTSAGRYSIQAARIREKAMAVTNETLRDQLLDLARHYSHLAQVASAVRAVSH